MQQNIGPEHAGEGPQIFNVAAISHALTGGARAAAGWLLAERDRWVLWLPVGIGAGIALYFSLPDEPSPWPAPLLLAAAVALAVRGHRRNRQGMLLAAWAAGAVALGFSVAQWRTVSVAAPVLQREIGPTGVVGRIVEVEPQAAGSRVTLEHPRLSGLAANRTPERIRLVLRGKQPDLAPGRWLRALAKVGPPPAPAAPGAFDFQRHSWFNRLGGTGFALGPVRLLAAPPEGALQAWAEPGLALDGLRQRLTGRIMAALPGAGGAVAVALMTGQRGAIPKDILARIRDAGLAHLLAISGLHIGLVAGFLFVLLRAVLALVPGLALNYPIKKWAAAAAIPGALAYALVAGATVPSLRAFVMISLVLLAVLVDRRGLSLRLVAWAASVILLFRPESLLGPSFQMSFAAVVALIAAYEALAERLRPADNAGPASWLRRPALYLGGIAVTSLIAGLATAPFAIYHFNRFAAFGLAANMVAVPVAALWIMPWALAAFALMPMGLEQVALVPMGWGIDVVLAVAETVAAWPGAVALLAAMPAWGMGLVALGGVWLCLWRRRGRLAGVPAMAAGMAAMLATAPPDVLVDGQGRLFGVTGDDGRLRVSTRRAGRYTREQWLRRLGQPGANDGDKAKSWPAHGRAMNGQLACDIRGCIFSKAGHRIAFVRLPRALLEDCGLADVVITADYLRAPCPGPALVIDRGALRRAGGFALWLEKGGRMRVETVAGGRGRRPWVPRRQQPGRANSP